MSIIGLGGAFIALVLDMKPLYFACCALFAIGGFPMTPVLLELITRKFDNIPLHISNTLLYVISQIFTAIMQQIITFTMSAFGEERKFDAGSFAFNLILYMVVLMFAFIGRMDDDVQ